MTIFEKCGISNEMVEEIKRKGFFVPEKHERFPNPLKSIGFPELVYEWADSFTPPLTKEERERYVRNPEDFYKDAVKSSKLFKGIAELLLKVLKNIRDLSPPEATATCLAVLRIYYASFDYNFYKYDRHLEFHDYEESPVGHYYLRLKELCGLVANRKKIPNPDLWAQEKLLFLLTSPFKTSMSIRFEMDCAVVYQRLAEIAEFTKFFQDHGQLYSIVQQKYPNLSQKIEEIGGKYYKYPEDFLRDCLYRGGKKPEKILHEKEKAKKSYIEVKECLSAEEIGELEKCIQAIEWFNEIQEEMTFIIDSKIGDNQVRDAEFRTFEVLKEIIDQNPWIVKRGYQSEIEKIFGYKGLEGIIAPRILVYNAEHNHYFIPEVEVLFFEELGRWFSRNE